MADISFNCLVAIRDMGSMLGSLMAPIVYENERLVENILDLVDEVALDLLEYCPHPPNVVSDTAPPRTFRRQIRELRGGPEGGGWRDQPADDSVRQIEALHATLYSWLEGMTGATPSATFIGGGAPGTIPSEPMGAPVWQEGLYQISTRAGPVERGIARGSIRRWSGG